MRVSAPPRPSLGALFVAACTAWAVAAGVEQLTWLAFLGQLSWPGRRVVAAAALTGALALAIAVHVHGKARCRRMRRPDARGALGLLPARSLALVAIVAAVACACCVLYWHAWASGQALVERHVEDGLVVQLTGDAATRDYGEVSTGTVELEGRTIALRLLWPDDAEPASAGHAVYVTGSFSAAAEGDGGHWNHRQGYVGMLCASTACVQGTSSGLRGMLAGFRDASFQRISALGGDAAGLLAGILLGNRTLYAGTQLEQDFQTTGLAHLMAVSGTHLAVVSALLGWVLARTRLPRLGRAVATACLLTLYVGLTCLAPSALRALAMCMAASLAGLSGRRGHVVSALSAVVLVFVCVNPPSAFSTGFQLSVLAVAGLVLLAPLVEAWLAWLLPQRLEALCSPCAATLAATACTLPVTVPMFSQLPVISPVSTLLASPLVTLALGLGIPALLLSVAVPAAGTVLLQCAGAVGNMTAALVHALADVPGACLPVQGGAVFLSLAFATGIVAAWACWPLPPAGDVREAATDDRRPAAGRDGRGATCGGEREVAGRDGSGAVGRDGSEDAVAHAAGDGCHDAFPAPNGRALRAGVACACLIAPLAVVLVASFGGVGATVSALDANYESDAQVVMVDVGQGDCMLIRDGDAAVLVDTGEDEQLLLEGLARNGITHLDAVFITHADADHCGALAALSGVVAVEHVYVHAGLLGTDYVADIEQDAAWVTTGGQLEGVAVGTQTSVGSFTLTLVAPLDAGESDNEDSLVNVLEYDEDGDGQPEARALLTGDAEAEAVEGVIDEVGDIDVLKVAHHGSAGASSAEQLSVLSPQIALIGVGADNTYGHPTDEMLELLAQCHATVYRTDEDGDITLTFSGTSIAVDVQNG